MNDNNQFNNSGSSNNSNWDDQKRPPNINNNYLNSLKPSIGSETNKWMLNLKEDLSNQLPDLIPNSSNELSISHDKISNKLYDQLSKYAFEFSKDVASQELKISTELPSKVNIPSTSLIPNGKSNYGLQGHLYTRKWSLVLRSEPAMIKVFVIPTQFLIRLSTSPAEFNPYLEFKLNLNQGVWQIENEEISLDTLSTIGKRLFAYYIQVLQGVCDGSEKFYLKGQKPEPVVLNRQIADSGPALLSSSDNSAQMTSNLPPNINQASHPANFQTNSGSFNPVLPPQAPLQPQNMSPSGFGQGFNQAPAQGFNQAPAQGFNQAPVQGFNQAPAQGVNSVNFNQGQNNDSLQNPSLYDKVTPVKFNEGSTVQAELSRLQENSQMVVIVIESMNREFDLVLNTLTQISAQAMTNQDMVTALKSLKAINALKTQKENLGKFLNEWKEIINS